MGESKPYPIHTPSTAEQILERYAKGERNFERVDVPEGSSFQGADLSGASFKTSWVSGIDFREAKLRGVCFDECNVKVSDFRGADLTDATFRNALLCGASFSTAKVDNVIVAGATWYGCAITDIHEIQKLGYLK